jgi:predicted Zn-ribbon and HTH transcriptional regulator
MKIFVICFLDIKRARHMAGFTLRKQRKPLSAREAAELIHCTTNAWQKWEATGTNAREMHPAFWELFCIKARLNCARCNYPFGDDWLDDGETCPQCKLVQ